MLYYYSVGLQWSMGRSAMETEFILIHTTCTVWLSWLGTAPQSKRLPVQFPVRAQGWVVGTVPGQSACERQPFNIFLLH